MQCAPLIRSKRVCSSPSPANPFTSMHITRCTVRRSYTTNGWSMSSFGRPRQDAQWNCSSLSQWRNYRDSPTHERRFLPSMRLTSWWPSCLVEMNNSVDPTKEGCTTILIIVVVVMLCHYYHHRHHRPLRIMPFQLLLHLLHLLLMFQHQHQQYHGKWMRYWFYPIVWHSTRCLACWTHAIRTFCTID